MYMGAPTRRRSVTPSLSTSSGHRTLPKYDPIYERLSDLLVKLQKKESTPIPLMSVPVSLFLNLRWQTASEHWRCRRWPVLSGWSEVHRQQSILWTHRSVWWQSNLHIMVIKNEIIILLIKAYLHCCFQSTNQFYCTVCTSKSNER